MRRRTKTNQHLEVPLDIVVSQDPRHRSPLRWPTTKLLHELFKLLVICVEFGLYLRGV
ncbi:MAG: hypothetical protein WCJ35_24615 [Planctomycetota bacterium]